MHARSLSQIFSDPEMSAFGSGSDGMGVNGSTATRGRTNVYGLIESGTIHKLGVDVAQLVPLKSQCVSAWPMAPYLCCCVD